jgi:hypothetical protein
VNHFCNALHGNISHNTLDHLNQNSSLSISKSKQSRIKWYVSLMCVCVCVCVCVCMHKLETKHCYILKLELICGEIFTQWLEKHSKHYIWKLVPYAAKVYTVRSTPSIWLIWDFWNDLNSHLKLTFAFEFWWATDWTLQEMLTWCASYISKYPKSQTAKWVTDLERFWERLAKQEVNVRKCWL